MLPKSRAQCISIKEQRYSFGGSQGFLTEDHKDSFRRQKAKPRGFLQLKTNKSSYIRPQGFLCIEEHQKAFFIRRAPEGLLRTEEHQKGFSNSTRGNSSYRRAPEGLLRIQYHKVFSQRRSQSLLKEDHKVLS